MSMTKETATQLDHVEDSVKDQTLFDEETKREHEQTFRQALRDERGVILWATVFAAAALSWGFDAQVVSIPNSFFILFVWDVNW